MADAHAADPYILRWKKINMAKPFLSREIDFSCLGGPLGPSRELCWGHVGPILRLSKGARCILRSVLGQVGILLDLEGIGVPPGDFWYSIFGGMGWPSWVKSSENSMRKSVSNAIILWITFCLHSTSILSGFHNPGEVASPLFRV